MYKKERFLSLDYIKGITIVLIILMHSIVAYSTFGAYGPVNKAYNIILFDYLVMFIDAFAIPLLFLISGFFIWKSLQRQGVKKYVKKRLIRLGIPWLLRLVIERILIKTSIAFSGPLWFIIVLLFFNIVVVIFYLFFPTIDQKFKDFNYFNNSLIVIIMFLLLAWITYNPLLLFFKQGEWITFGPIKFGVSRIFLHFTFFILGVILGSVGIKKTVFSKEHKMHRYWPVWLFFGIIFLFFKAKVSPFFFPPTIVFLVFAVLGFFNTHLTKKISLLQNLASNSYGIYIIHFIFVTSLQFIFVSINVGGIFKGVIIFCGSVVLAWTTTILLRKIPLIRKVI